MKSEVTLPIRMGYNFGNSLLLTRKSYVVEEEGRRIRINFENAV
jgi:hypothetical protein